MCQSGLINTFYYDRFLGVRIYARCLLFVGQVAILAITCVVAYCCLRPLFMNSREEVFSEARTEDRE